MALQIRGTELRGMAFPLTKGRDGFFPRRNSRTLRQSSIIMILGTTPGERVGNPEFGSLIPTRIFEPNDQILLQEIREDVLSALQRWDANLRVLAVSLEQTDDSIKIFIDFIDLADPNEENRRSVFSLRRG